MLSPPLHRVWSTSDLAHAGEADRVADAEEALDRDGERHEDAARHPDVAGGVDQQREQQRECLTNKCCKVCIDNHFSSQLRISNKVCLTAEAEAAHAEVDTTEEDEDCINDGESDEQFIETSFVLGARQHDDGDDIADNTNTGKDSHQNPAEVILGIINY